MEENSKVYIKNETNLTLEEVISEVNLKRSEYVTKKEFLEIISNLDFESIRTASLSLVTGFKCYFDEKDKLVINTYDKDIRINY